MTNAELEKRLVALERELSDLKAELLQRPGSRWESTIGAFANDPGFDEIVRLGREWREEANKDCGQ